MMNDHPIMLHRWEEIQELFEAALLIDKADWPAFLFSRCGDDTNLAARVHELLIADHDSGQFLAEGPLLNLLPEVEATKQGVHSGIVLCGRFKVLNCLGTGGMGQVYEAVDLELNQRIAIKAIRADIVELPGVLSRFKREVYTTRKITHPNICRTFDLESDLGVTFLTMELLRGETLADRLRRIGPLSAAEAHDAAVQVADGLCAAHAAGVVHCDLKPSNVFMTGPPASQRAVVTDFGIARIIQSEEHSLLLPHQSQFTPGVAVAGTPAYMAPEQFERGQCSPASDIYSFGLILYEALTGERLSPFNRSLEQLHNKLHDAGLGPDQNRQWSLLLTSCLQADPDLRLKNIQQVLEALEGKPQRATHRTSHVLSSRALWAAASLILIVCLTTGFYGYRRLDSTPAGPAAALSVAILPFNNPGEEPDLKLLGSNIAASLTNDLARFSGLTVPSQTALTALGPHADLRTLRRQLHSDSIVEGSMTRVQDHLLIQVALVDSKSGAHRWGQSYERRESDLASLENDLSLEIAYQLRKDSDNSATAPRKIIPSAEDAFRRGEAALVPTTPQSVESAVSDFQQAIDTDPSFARAYERLARCYLFMAATYNRPEASNDLRARADAAARRAVELDGTLSAAHADLATAEVFGGFEWDEAERSYLRAIQTDQNYAPAHLYYAFYLLTARGRFAEARAQFAYVDRTASASGSAGNDVIEAVAEYYARHYEESVRRAEAIRKNHPDNEILVEILSENYLAMNQPAKALEVLRNAKVQSPDAKVSRDVMSGIALSQLGNLQKARAIFNQISQSKGINFDLNFHLASLAAAVGEQDAAFRYLEDAYRSRQTSVLFLGVDPLMDLIRSDPRFLQLLSRMNLTIPTESRSN